MPNSLAYIALISWPFISLLLFSRLQTIPATFWTIVGGFLLLPASFNIDFPLIPPLDKNSIPGISALIGCTFVKNRHINLIPKQGIIKWLLIILILSLLFSTLTNQEPIFDGKSWIRGLTFYDAITAVIKQYIFLLPFILGLQLFKSYDDQLLLFKLLVISGLYYLLPILFEIRMSPQLHTWFYGYNPSSFLQQMRFDGFRATVFIGHGLMVATFIAVVLGAAAILWKNNIKTLNMPPFFLVVVFFMLLLLCKSVGPFLYGSFLVLALAWLPIGVIKRSSQFIILIVLMYPLLSIFNLFPHQELVEFSASFDADRAQSLDFRFYNENKLLEHAKDKFFFGWGTWGRNRLWDSITDGYWIIVLGQSGIIGFIAIFGLLTVATFQGIKSISILDDIDEKRALTGHILIVAIIMADQLLNASLSSSWLWLIIGALIGRSNHLLKENKYKYLTYKNNKQ